MSSESSQSIKVRLEIEIPNCGLDPVIIRRHQHERHERFLRFETTQPPAAAGRQILARPGAAGTWLICTQGTGAAPGRPVFVAVFPQNAAPNPLAGPPEGAAWHYADGGGGWGKSAPFEVPVALPDGTNTLIVWSDALTGLVSPPNIDFTMTRSNRTECDDSSGIGSSGSPSGVLTTCCPAQLLPTTLQAHVTNGGTLNGVFPVTNSGASGNPTWQALPAGSCTAFLFRLVCLGTSGTWGLVMSNGNVYTPTSAVCPPLPFQVVFTGVDLSSCGATGGTNATVTVLGA